MPDGRIDSIMPENKWDRFRSAVNRAGRDMDFRSVTLYQWTRNYDPSTGKYDTTLEIDAELHNCEVIQPSDPPTVTGPDGGDAEADVNIYIPDPQLDGIDIIETGEQQRASVIEDTTSGVRYSVTSAFNSRNGLLTISGVER